MTDEHSDIPRRSGHQAWSAIVLLATALATLMAACNDRTPTKSSALVTAPSFSRSLNTPVSGDLVSDARGRLSNSIADLKTRAALQRSLDALSASLDAGDAVAARREIETSRKLIAAGLKSEDAADLSAISLALDQLETQLAAPSASATAQP